MREPIRRVPYYSIGWPAVRQLPRRVFQRSSTHAVEHARRRPQSSYHGRRRAALHGRTACATDGHVWRWPNEPERSDDPCRAASRVMVSRMVRGSRPRHLEGSRPGRESTGTETRPPRRVPWLLHSSRGGTGKRRPGAPGVRAENARGGRVGPRAASRSGSLAPPHERVEGPRGQRRKWVRHVQPPTGGARRSCGHCVGVVTATCGARGPSTRRRSRVCRDSGEPGEDEQSPSRALRRHYVTQAPNASEAAACPFSVQTAAGCSRGAPLPACPTPGASVLSGPASPGSATSGVECCFSSHRHRSSCACVAADRAVPCSAEHQCVRRSHATSR